MARRKRTGARPPQAETPPNLPAANPASAGSDLYAGARTAFPIVCIGASAGGLHAVSELLRNLPADTGMGFVVVQHLHPSHPSMLAEILQRDSPIPVAQAENNTTVEPDHVYVIPPGCDMVIGDTRLQLSPRTEQRGQHRSIDRFMRSLAEEQGFNSIGVILSGSDNDGTQGLDEIKAAGGITFAQDGTAEHSIMPRNATASGSVDFVLPPDEIGRELGRISRHPLIGGQAEAARSLPAKSEPDVRDIIDLLRRTTGVDFSNYKRNTLHRRITRRMVLQKVEGTADYLRHIESHPEEAQALYQDILINVTSFFRNPEAFEALKAEVFPRLTKDKGRNEQMRIWALGCSTGEEAYSLAMLYTEYAEESGQRVPMQIFATDLNGAGIERARAGIFSKGIVQDLSPERLRRFFVEVDGSYRICKPIRDMCVFARQNVLSDPPFSRIDLIACRNMLIYLEPVLQHKLMPVLHYALRPGGCLWLGTSETIGTFRDLFELQDARNKIYLRKPGGAGEGSTPLRVPMLPGSRLPRVELAKEGAPAGMDPQKEADRMLLASYAPAGVVLNSELEIVQLRGDTSLYLAPASGRPSFNILKMLREGLLVAVRGAVHKARREQQVVRADGLRFKTDGGSRIVNIVVMPIRGEGDGGLLLLFEDPALAAEHARQSAIAQPPTEAAEGELPRLRQELDSTREYLQSVIEQQEAANEELQSANEEVQSANEELQSINEELETSKEEIQSSNEELATVNDELNNRNHELARTSSDVINLLSSVHLAIVMLGPDLRIRRYTPIAEKMLNLIPTDVGRPIGDLKLRIAIPDLDGLIADVVDNVIVREQEVQDQQGRWYSLRVRPYRTLENKIDGAVLVAVDIDALKRAEEVLHESDRLKNEFLATLSHELRNPLGALRNAAEFIRSAPPGADLTTAREVLDRQSQSMVRLVDDLLDLARISHGSLRLLREPTDLVGIMQAAVSATDHIRATLAQQLTLRLPAPPVQVLADPARIEQVFVNLLSNASKFTPQNGKIWIDFEAQAATDGTPAANARIAVHDNGIGIPPTELKQIFEMFARGTAAGDHGGLGLGLALAKQIVLLHGGTIDALSEGASRGSAFVVHLPLLGSVSPRLPVKSSSPETPPGAPRRVLVVDDNADGAAMIALSLRRQGHVVEVVNDGVSAVDAALAFLPEVVLLDLGLGVIDGCDVARAMRAQPALRSATLIALTGFGRDSDIQRSREAGMSGHLVKPVALDQLDRLLRSVG